ncbi:MAG: hypothetical protein GY702_18770 [Desulfobulbaceae bacterium]|nr:hypothetical protein [Desulfobulbaceae bacterium]
MTHIDKIHIGGIKFSEKLTHISVQQSSAPVFSMSELLHQVAEKNINIPFLCASATKQVPTTSFCVDSSDFSQLQQILSQSIFEDLDTKVVPEVGLCTVFPHRNSLGLLGKIIHIFGEFTFPLYSFSTSISALAFTTDFCLLDNVAEKLETIVELPRNHAPFRQEFQLKQPQL